MSEGYRLESLLKLRRQEEDTAEAALAEAEAHLTAAQARVGEAAARVAAAREHLDEARERLRAGGPLRAAAMAAAEAFAERCRRSLTATEVERDARLGEAAAAERGRDEARAAVVEAKRARETVEKHKARWEAEQRQGAARREEAMLDELAQRTPRGEKK